MKSKLNIYTSFVNPESFNWFIKNEYLPVIVIRSITNSKVIGKWNGTAIHFRNLAPSTELYQARRDNRINQEEYEKRYILELMNQDLQGFIKKLEQLATYSNAKGIIILGYGDYEICHRKVLSKLLNNLDVLENEIREFNLW